ILVEPIQGEGGVNSAAPGYLRSLRELCDERGMLLMLDEIQTGFGRTGRWFGFEHDGIRPDVVTMAKAMGNGMPIGATWARREVAAAFQPGHNVPTYTATPTARGATPAVIAEMERSDAPACAERAGARLRAALESTPGV